VQIRIHSAIFNEIIAMYRTTDCAADNNELEAFDVTDNWCCYVGNEEDLHVLVLCLTG
jgi:hypothetical protein